MMGVRRVCGVNVCCVYGWVVVWTPGLQQKKTPLQFVNNKKKNNFLKQKMSEDVGGGGG
jgi:hypothetical protein